MPANTAKILITAILVFSLGACPLLAVNLSIGQAAASGPIAQPIEFTPNLEELELTAAADPGFPSNVVTPQPALIPGLVYDELNKPEISLIEDGDEEFGYGPTAENPDIYLMWITDETGTHYFTVDANSEQLLGTIDESTGSRRENGFVHLVEQRDERLQAVIDGELEVSKHQNARMSYHAGAVGVAFVGGIVCAVVTGGACIVAFAGGALAAWVNGVAQNGEKVSAQEELDHAQERLDEASTALQGKFDQTVAAAGAP